MWSYLKKIDWPIMLAVALLNFIGLLTIYSIGSDEALSFFERQLFFVFLGFIVIFIFSFLDYRIFKNHSSVLIILYFISLILLIAVLFFGQRVNGARSWFRIGELNLQPIEIVKIIIILMLAKYFSSRHIEMYRIRHIVISGVYVILPVFLVALQPDLGSTFVLLAIWLGVMIIAGIKIRHLIVIGVIAILIMAAGWFWVLKDYQQERIITFLNPQQDIYGQGYNIFQSLIAVGSGRLMGHGLSGATQSRLNFLPEQQGDFIFATFSEQWGLIGVIILLFVFAILFWRMINIALNIINNFVRLFVLGLIILVFSQLMINIGMNLGIFPVIGLPLPFVSYGGSGLLALCIGIGIIQSIKIRN